MGGKSSYVRMVAIISLMGQIGSHVPASFAKLPVLDNIFTRMGAGDDLASGRSTFMTELFRTSRIIQAATPRSLVILDELGRGTSTHDGVAIAQATLNYFLTSVGCATLFVTHFPQISEMVSQIFPKKAINVHRGYIEGVDDQGRHNILFLYKAVEGPAKGSYGLNVARLAGLDAEFVKVAAAKSKWMRNKFCSSSDIVEMEPEDSSDEKKAITGSKRALEKDLNSDEMRRKEARSV